MLSPSFKNNINRLFFRRQFINLPRWTHTKTNIHKKPLNYFHPLLLLTSGLTIIYYLDTNTSLFRKIALSSMNTQDIYNFIDLCHQNDLLSIERKLKDQYNLNEPHQLGWYPLHVAVVKNNLELTKLLLKYKANVNCEDQFQFANYYKGTSNAMGLHKIIFERERFCNLIRVDAQTFGFTPLHYACFNGNFEIIQLLTEHGADPTKMDQNGYVAKDYLDNKLRDYNSIVNHLNSVEKKQKEDKERREKEIRKKFPIEQQLHAKIVGQVTPINAVASAIRRKENGNHNIINNNEDEKNPNNFQLGWYDEDKPLVFLFLGSSGVGKTELAKQIANYTHKNNETNGFIRMDMSEFQSKHEVAKFIGSPPGYVGYEEGGQLTEKLSQCPNAVVLLDEVEKAHPDVLTIMLQVFDEGRLTDGKGTIVNCKDAIFIMTSNLAQQEIAEEAQILRKEARLRDLDINNINNDSNNKDNTAIVKDSDKEDKNMFSNLYKGIYNSNNNKENTVNVNKDKNSNNELTTINNRTIIQENKNEMKLSKNFIDSIIYPILRHHFKRDEFLGRISEILYFLPFDEVELITIVEMELNKWGKKAKSKHNITLTWSQEVIKELSKGYNYRYGARSIQHEVEQRVINVLAKAYELDQIKKGNKIFLSLNEEALIQLNIEK
ncbi:hypothetical protein K502DRAFT_350388 [Neoconidiobolus thromboides FSU 785]|nr:hypothetical protein K502DRAFT_350388 [Neoconidiobolus thromboides FSU 785]